MIIVISLKSKKLKKVLKGIGVAIIIYITFSILATMLVHNFVFKRYDGRASESFFSKKDSRGVSQTSFSYRCGGNVLKGYLYCGGESADGLIVFAPGFRSQIFDYEGVVYAFLQEGFDVFVFDPTGHGQSGGKSSVGFAQIIKDIDATLEFINNNKNFEYSDIFLLGHSRGGYGVCCTMNSHPDVTAAVSVNGADTSMDAIMAYSVGYIGPIAYVNYPFLSLYQDIVFGREISDKSAIKEIDKSHIPVLVIHAENDNQIPKDKYSIYSNRGKTNSRNAEFLLYNKNGYNEHNTIFCDESNKINYDVVKIISEFYKQKTNDKGLSK